MIFNYFIKNGENWLYSNLKRMRFIAFIRNYSSFYYDSKKHNIPKDSRFVALPAKLCTVISIIQLVNQCNKGGNSFVTNISEKIISLEHIKKLLEQRLPIPIKIVFLNYIKRIYLDNIDELEEYEFNEYFVLFESLQNTLINIEDSNYLGANKEISNYSIITFSGCYKCSQWDEKFKLTMLQSMSHLFTKALANPTTNLVAESKKF